MQIRTLQPGAAYTVHSAKSRRRQVQSSQSQSASDRFAGGTDKKDLLSFYIRHYKQDPFSLGRGVRKIIDLALPRIETEYRKVARMTGADSDESRDLRALYLLAAHAQCPLDDSIIPLADQQHKEYAFLYRRAREDSRPPSQTIIRRLVSSLRILAAIQMNNTLRTPSQPLDEVEDIRVDEDYFANKKQERARLNQINEAKLNQAAQYLIQALQILSESNGQLALEDRMTASLCYTQLGEALLRVGKMKTEDGEADAAKQDFRQAHAHLKQGLAIQKKMIASCDPKLQPIIRFEMGDTYADLVAIAQELGNHYEEKFYADERSDQADQVGLHYSTWDEYQLLPALMAFISANCCPD